MNIKHDKKKVIQIGINLFCSRGYSNVGLEEICKETGMTKGAFYNAFNSKENFLLETLASFDKSNTERITDALKPNSKIRSIDQLYEFYAMMLKMQPKMNFMGCMINNMMSELGFVNENVATVTSEGFEKIIKAVEPAVKRAQKEGDINPDYNSKEIATLLHSTFYGVLTRAKSLGSNKKGFITMKLLFNNLKNK